MGQGVSGRLLQGLRDEKETPHQKQKEASSGQINKACKSLWSPADYPFPTWSPRPADASVPGQALPESLMPASRLDPGQDECLGPRDPQCQGLAKGGELSGLKGFICISDLIFSKVRCLYMTEARGSRERQRKSKSYHRWQLNSGGNNSKHVARETVYRGWRRHDKGAKRKEKET